MGDVIIILVSNPFFTTLLLGLLFGVISIIRKPKPLKINTVAEAFTSYYFLFPIGISYLINFIFHVFFGEMTAEFIGWKDSPFQAEVGFASLGIGIAGVIAFKSGFPFRLAAFLPPAFFTLGAAGGHIYQMIVAHNFSPGNVGLVLPSDIITPILGIIFLWMSYKYPKPGAGKPSIK